MKIDRKARKSHGKVINFKNFCDTFRVATSTAQAIVRKYVGPTCYRTKSLYDRKINVRVRRNRHKLSYDRTTQYDGIVRNSYDSLWPFRPSYECILHSYDSLCRCLWEHDSLWLPLGSAHVCTFYRTTAPQAIVRSHRTVVKLT